MAVPRIRAVVSRKGIRREINKARKKLAALEKRAAPRKRDAIQRQLLQLKVCEEIIFDFYIMGP